MINQTEIRPVSPSWKRLRQTQESFNSQ